MQGFQTKKAKRHYRPKHTPCLTDAPAMPSEALPPENAVLPHLKEDGDYVELVIE
ncbi:hypothetical protein NEIPOLOT_01839 [Neisseria polysaccharea ATCC 43768]|nr:hypothetical protein NEIPOLOT_01839 [Neisseria polysaccharea ATCC 43768]